MKQLSSLEIHYLIKELKFLINSKVDTIYQPDKKELLLQFYVSNKGKQILKIVAGKAFYLTNIKESCEEPPSFCMFLRKHLGNARLREINQKGSERIVELVFQGKEVKKLLIEFFGGGNIILCDKEDIILSALEYHKWKDREIRAKIKYKYPEKGYDLFNLKLKEIKDLLKNSKKDSIVTCLAVELGIGGTYAEEVCLLSKIDKLLKPQLVDTVILESIKKIVNNKIKAIIYYENKELKDAVPFELMSYRGLEKKEFKTYNEALDYYSFNKAEKKETGYEKEIKRLKNILEKQKDKINELGEKKEENRKKAEKIYNNYNLIKNIMDEVNKAVKKYSWKEIKEKLRGNKLIKEVDAKEKKIIVELD